MTDREAIARIISPKNARRFDAGDPSWKTLTHWRRAQQKADAILSYLKGDQ